MKAKRLPLITHTEKKYQVRLHNGALNSFHVFAAWDNPQDCIDHAELMKSHYKSFCELQVIERLTGNIIYTVKATA